MTHKERSEVTDLLTALLLEAKKTNTLLNLMARQGNVSPRLITEALRDTEHQHEEERQK